MLCCLLFGVVKLLTGDRRPPRHCSLQSFSLWNVVVSARNGSGVFSTILIPSLILPGGRRKMVQCLLRRLNLYVISSLFHFLCVFFKIVANKLRSWFSRLDSVCSIRLSSNNYLQEVRIKLLEISSKRSLAKAPYKIYRK
jgi:hypothetical protein